MRVSVLSFEREAGQFNRHQSLHTGWLAEISSIEESEVKTMTEFVGIDISKDTFDFYFEEAGRALQWQLQQSETDYETFIKLTGSSRCCVMEATGNYHLKLVNYLHRHGIEVVVENPLKIKRYGQMKLQRTKTDKADAKLIFDYGKQILLHSRQTWQPTSGEIHQLKQYDTLSRQLSKQMTALSNTYHAMQHLEGLDDEIARILRETIQGIKKTIDELDGKMLELVKASYHESFDLITSVPGVGPKTAVMLLCLTDGFRRFDDVRKFVSYIGMSPRTYESGSSIKGKGHITKVGNGRMRSLLYLCSWTAKSCNPQCKALYEKLEKRGKPEKVMKVAIAHKLLRQVFGIMKRGEPFCVDVA